ncbi:MAG: hypothetical protein AAGA18_08495 [Verrucomicrobiota bacterium]
MAKNLIIVHGYSDGYMQKNNSFAKLKKFLVKNQCYASSNIRFVEYSSLDDQATFEDFADKLDSDYEKYFKGKRVDVLCHSTGSLVTRAWLNMRRKRQRALELDLDIPVHRLFLFAPANFGSDLARMGQSFLGKIKSTFLSKSAHRKEFGESGKIVLQGLEPASPYQWDLSMQDLHDETYFGPNDDSEQVCLPFVFAAGNGYGGIQATLMKARNKPGTDGVIRIPGTSINSRKCTLAFQDKGPILQWAEEKKHASMPMCVFQGFNHGSIINVDDADFLKPDGPGTLLLAALKVNTLKQYQNRMPALFHQAQEANDARAKDEYKDVYQQFFFKVRDDVGFDINDFFLDFQVELPEGTQDPRNRQKNYLNKLFDEKFERRFTNHSQDRSLRVMLINLRELNDVMKEIKKAKAKLKLVVNAAKPYNEVSYAQGEFVVFDSLERKGKNPSFLFPNTTTMLEIVLNRQPSDKILQIRRM